MGRRGDRRLAEQKRARMKEEEKARRDDKPRLKLPRVRQPQGTPTPPSSYTVSLSDPQHNEHVEWCNAAVNVSDEDKIHNQIPHTKVLFSKLVRVDWTRHNRFTPSLRIGNFIVYIRDGKDFGGREGMIKELVAGTADCPPLHQFEFVVDCHEHLSICKHEWHTYQSAKYANPYDAQLESYIAIHRMGEALRSQPENS